jgi:hypothetical protein
VDDRASRGPGRAVGATRQSTREDLGARAGRPRRVAVWVESASWRKRPRWPAAGLRVGAGGRGRPGLTRSGFSTPPNLTSWRGPRDGRCAPRARPCAGVPGRGAGRAGRAGGGHVNPGEF